MEIYLDNSATTRVFPEVAELMNKIYTEEYGNPSSAHRKGVEAEEYLRKAGKTLSKILRCRPGEIIYTSGGTESDNLALIGTVHAKKRQGNHLITTQIEHPAVLRAMEYLEREEGCSVTYLPVDAEGHVSVETLEKSINDKTVLVSVMHTNNEIGAVQPVEAIGTMLKKKYPNVTFHVDAVQGFGKMPIFPHSAGIDLMSVSGHKIHGPKGVGFLFADEKVKLAPIIFGGGQQAGMRSGTENVPGIAGMALAAEKLCGEMEKDEVSLRALRKYLGDRLSEIEGVQLNGPETDGSAPHILSVSFRGVRSEVLLHALEEKGIYVSAGSACATHKAAVSDTLQAIGLEKSLMDSTLRFSLSIFTTKEEIEYTVDVISKELPELRKYTRY
ncbi:MAG: cysteine desulfurase [Lachnospiraceae bacterium]|nr:cysteine desulfurase [Lachnospiraceae bacterium]